MPSDSYPFAVGRIRGLERSCLDEAAFRRFEEQPLAAAVKALADSGYGQEAENKSDPDALIDAEMKNLRGLIEELTPDRRLTDLFWLLQDAINLKLLLKARLLEEDAGAVSADGLFPAELLKDAVENRDYSALPAALSPRMEAVERLIDSRTATAAGMDPLTLSAAVDKAIYGAVFAELKTARGRFVERYFRAKVDFTNVLSLLRARALRWSRQKFETVLLPDGETGEKELLNAYELPAENLERSIRFGSSDSAMKRGIAAYLNENQSVPAAAAVFDRALMAVAGEERFDSFGIGPVVYYLLRKSDEGQRLRVLFAHKRRAPVKNPNV